MTQDLSRVRNRAASYRSATIPIGLDLGSEASRDQSLELRVHSGETGLDRRVFWAHAIEIERPWEWLDVGDLLMTVGIGLPSELAGQVEYPQISRRPA